MPDPSSPYQSTQAGQPDTLPKGVGRPVVLPSAATVGVALMGQNVFMSPDVAYRADRTLQQQMRNDPDVGAPLEQRILATAMQEWEVVPCEEWADVPEAQDQASAIEQGIDSIPGFTQLRRNQLLSVWYGHGASNVLYSLLEEPIVRGKAAVTWSPVKWLPIHPDSVVFDIWGNLVLKVNAGEMARRKMAIPDDQLTTTESGQGVKVNDAQRKNIILTVSGVEGAPFESTMETADPYNGIGLRSRLWWTWWMKQKATQLQMTYIERIAMGKLIGRFPSGNNQAQQQMQETLLNLVQDAGATLPSLPAPNDKDYDITILEASGRGWQLFRDTRMDFQEQMMKSIIGQSMTMNAEASGLGSGNADVHSQSFERIVRFDAACLDDSMTSDLVEPMRIMNFPESKYRFKYRTIVDRVKVEQSLNAIKQLFDMGARIPESAVMEIAGVPMAKGDEPVLQQGEAIDQIPGIGGSPDEIDSIMRSSPKPEKAAA